MTDGGVYTRTDRNSPGMKLARKRGREAAKFCETCQSNGEVVTDWERYMHGPLDENGEDAVAPCPDCNGGAA